MVTPGIKDKLTYDSWLDFESNKTTAKKLKKKKNKHSFARATRQKGLLQRATSYYKLFFAKSCLQIPTVRHHSISVGL